MSPRLLFILSAPRSGSTVLTSLLDRHTGVISIPESGFPQVLSYLTEEIWRNKELVAAIYLCSCYGGSLLSLAEVSAGVMADRRETLVALGLAEAAKAGRDITNIRWIVWKNTRIVTAWRHLDEFRGKFAIIRRNPINIYESYQRVDFAAKNRKPLRFAVYFRGYEAAFRDYPGNVTFCFDYPRTQQQLPEFLGMLDIDPDDIHGGPSTLSSVSGRFEFHSEILGEFRDEDAEKRGRIPAKSLVAVERALKAVQFVDPFCGWLRKWADRRQARTIIRNARSLLADR